jgi:hypothetical protein
MVTLSKRKTTGIKHHVERIRDVKNALKGKNQLPFLSVELISSV